METPGGISGSKLGHRSRVIGDGGECGPTHLFHNRIGPLRIIALLLLDKTIENLRSIFRFRPNLLEAEQLRNPGLLEPFLIGDKHIPWGEGNEFRGDVLQEELNVRRRGVEFLIVRQTDFRPRELLMKNGPQQESVPLQSSRLVRIRNNIDGIDVFTQSHLFRVIH